LTLILFFFLTGCDPVFIAQIKNETTQPVTLKIKFDTVGLYKLCNNSAHTKPIDQIALVSFIKSYPYFDDIRVAETDSTNFINTYIIQPDGIFHFEYDLAFTKFDIFENMTLINKDTINLKTKADIKNAFKETDKGLWQLEIK
jgi:hypothetical protein